jgi:3-hydroxybutyryl-CoA dehydrogenase
MEVKTIGVIGAGTMGCGIAYAAACGGYRTVLEDFSSTTLEDSVAYIRQTLEESVAHGKVTPEQGRSALENLATARRVEDACREADLLIEASAEEMEVKLEIFTIFDKFAKPDAILASNTSSFLISDLAAMTFRAENCVGMHFSPVPNIKLLEIVRTLETSEATVQACAVAGRRMGREVAVVHEPARR